MLRKKEKNRCIKTHRLGIFFGLSLLFSLLLASFGLSSAWAIIPFTAQTNYRYSYNNGSIISSVGPNAGVGSVNVPWSENFSYNQYKVHSFSWNNNYSFDGLSYQGSLSLKWYYWNGNYDVLHSSDCSGIVVDFYPIDDSGNAIPLESVYTTITSCELVSGRNVLNVDLFASNSQIFSTTRFRLYITNEINGLIHCDVLDGLTGMCRVGSSHNFWGIEDFDLSLNSTTDPQTAILWEQLAIQRQEWAQNQRDRQDYTDLDGEGQQEGNSAGNDATNVGNSLLQIFQNFISTVYGIHATDCRLPDLQYNTLVLRNLDLCSLTIPQPLAVIGTISLIFVLVPLALHIVNRMINLYKEIFGQ